MRRIAGLCAIALALPAAGCGSASKDSSKGFKGQQKVVAVVVEDLEDAGRKNDPKRACTQLFAPALLAQIKKLGRNCDDAVHEAFADADTLDLTVDKVAIAGSTATVQVSSGSGSKKEHKTLSLVLQGKDWKIATLPA